MCLSVATGIAEHDRYAIDFIDAVAWIKKHLSGAYTSGGISNLSFAFRGNNPVRSAMHAVFLYHAIRAGLDMAIVNPAMLQQYDDIEPQLREAAEDVILCRRPDATARLTEMAARFSAPAAEASAPTPKALQGTPARRLQEALVSGHSATLEEDLMAVMQELGSAVKVLKARLWPAWKKWAAASGKAACSSPRWSRAPSS
jgi:methionine synthase (B12-dependent) (EC 2.1.1.13)